MRKILVCLLFAIPCFMQAQGLQKGYRGIVDAGYCLYTSQMDPSTFEVTTSHGYQFNPYIYLGAGLGFDFTGECKYGDISGKPYNKRESKVDIPLFFNARANFTNTKFSPFADTRIGAYVNNDGNIYANLALGARYGISDDLGLSFSVGYELRKVTVKQINMTTGSKYNNYQYDFYYTDRTGEELSGFVFKVGVDF